ncbi:hypothetical protein E2I00_011178, partial [Balaenoptera physalus]
SSVLRSPVDVSLASIVFGQNRPRDAPSSSPHPPSNLFITCNLWTNHSALLGLGDQPTSFSELSSSMPINHELPDLSKLFHGDRGCHQPPGLYASAGLLHLLAWATFPTNWRRRNPRVLSVSWRCNTSSGLTHFQDLQKPSQDEWGKTQAATEATVLMEKNLTQALLDLHALEPLPTGAGETHKEDGNHLTNVHRLGAPRLGWARISSKGSPSSTTRSL